MAKYGLFIMERPFGVTLLASFFFVQSVINVIIAFNYYASSAPLLPMVYYFLTSGAGFVLAYGLWIGYKWGRIGTMLLSGSQIIVGLLGLVVSLDFEATSPVQAVTKVIVYAIVIHFLTRPEISEYFKK
jgi:hypothetical protein